MTTERCAMPGDILVTCSPVLAIYIGSQNALFSDVPSVSKAFWESSTFRVRSEPARKGWVILAKK